MWHVALIFLSVFVIILGSSPWLLKQALRSHGKRIRKQTRRKRSILLKTTSLAAESKTILVGFFHPYCNAGGGGERVLWAAVRSTLNEYSNSVCVIYTGDIGIHKDEILEKAKRSFGIGLDSHRICFVFLNRRYLVSPETWPRFTLIGQSLGSIPLIYEAMKGMVPDIFIDTMGYAFTYPVVHFLFEIPVGSYTHYPTISSDMLAQLPNTQLLKFLYWKAFAKLYAWSGKYADIVMTNSTWTMQHIASLWKLDPAVCSIVYPPCDTEALQALQIETPRKKEIVCVAQFRKEKDHITLIRAFAQFIHKLGSGKHADAKLLLIGSVRHKDDRDWVTMLQNLADELGVRDSVDFRLDAPWALVVDSLGGAYIGANAMWNEHFGIGVVEYMAAGLIPVVHNSAGPKLDIVVPYGSLPTGFHATDVESFARAFDEAFSMDSPTCKAMRSRAQKSSERFSEEVFNGKWSGAFASLMQLQKKRHLERLKS